MNNNGPTKVLVTGAGGVLGQALVRALHLRKVELWGLSYREEEFAGIKDKLTKAFCCDVRQPPQLRDVCAGIDIVISVLGITRIKGEFTHMEIDYQGNLNLLNEAQKWGVKKFVFISPVGTEKGHKEVPLLKAKYLFEQELRKSDIDWLIFRSGGFFRDLAEMGKTARKGMMFIFGSGQNRFTPIDVNDLAEIMAESSLKENIKNQIIEVGGPEDLSWEEICTACFAFWGRKPVIIHIPLWLSKLTLALLKPFTPPHYALGKLILFSSTNDLITPKVGRTTFGDFLKSG